VLLIALVPLTWSYVRAIRAPGSAPLSAKSVEWVKGLPGGTWIVLKAERIWYSWNTPPTGGTTTIPQRPGQPGSPASPGGSGSHLPPHTAPPANIEPFVASPLPHEGEWQAVGKTVQGVPAVRVAYLRADAVHTSLLSGVMWMDLKLVQAKLIAGAQAPGGGGWPYGAEVPGSMYGSLVSTFNSGFLLKDSHGGYYSGGRTAAPLVNGMASLVIYKDGTVNIGAWGTDVTMTSQVQSVRQNLSILVDNGKPVPGLATDSELQWGATLGNSVLVWRSAVGVTADGALIYGAGPDLSVQSLANLMARAGAVRAMELDINPEWTTAMYYTPAPDSSLGIYPHKLLDTMQRSSERFLVPDERDFFAMLLRPKYAAK